MSRDIQTGDMVILREDVSFEEAYQAGLSKNLPYKVKYVNSFALQLEGSNAEFYKSKFELVEDKMSNKELLDYAVENIEGWLDDKWTHLRSDSPYLPFFWSNGDWTASGKVWGNEAGNFTQINPLYFKTSSPQVITKQEYLEEKEKRMKENSFIERNGKYNLEVTGEQLMFIWWCTYNTSSGTKGVVDLFNTLSNLPQCNETREMLSIAREPTQQLHTNKSFSELNEAFFTKPLSEEEKHLQFLQETINKAQAEIEKAQEQIKGLKKV